MTAYYPSQAGYASTQPVMYGPSQGYAQPGYGMSAGYAPTGGVMYVPSYNTGHHSHSHHHHHHNDYPYSLPQGAIAAQGMVQPGYNGQYYTFGARLRRFFGLAPTHGIRYKSDRSSWGFMGYSRRPRYVDPRTGGEVDREGRPVYRV